MKNAKSCGVIPFFKKDGEWRVIIIKQNNGVVGFPKGHVENNETEEETALREVKEETNLTPTIIKGFREEITYYISEYDVNKTVVVFVGLIDDISITKQISEISDIYICSIEEALERINFKETKNLFKKAIKFINNI